MLQGCWRSLHLYELLSDLRGDVDCALVVVVGSGAVAGLQVLAGCLQVLGAPPAATLLLLHISGCCALPGLEVHACGAQPPPRPSLAAGHHRRRSQA